MADGGKSVVLQLGALSFRLQYDIDALVMLEDLLDQPWDDIRAQLTTNQRVGFTRAVLWAGLQAHHPNLGLKPAGELLNHAEAEAIGPAIAAALRKAFPVDEGAASGAADPPQPAETPDP